MKRVKLVFALSIAIAVAAVGCGGAGPGSSAESTHAPTDAPPTFTRVTVTPAPIATPAPTPAPTVRPSFSDAELADPVLPDWLDPALNDEQPDDELVFAGWQGYLTNTFVQFGGGDRCIFAQVESSLMMTVRSISN